MSYVKFTVAKIVYIIEIFNIKHNIEQILKFIFLFLSISQVLEMVC